MDRPVTLQIQRKRRYRRLILLVLAAIGFLLCVWLVWRVLSTSIDADRLRTSVAEIGPISNTLGASGEVIPAYEQVIVSPIQADIQAVLKNAGEEVTAGTPVLQLDKSFLLLNLEKQQQELDLKANSITQLKFQLEKNQFDLEIRDSIKSLEISRLEAELDNARRLLNIGGGTDEDIREATLRLQVARLEKKQLENDLRILRQSTVTELRELEIQRNIQRNSLSELQEKLKRAEVVAVRPGVITWVNENIGSTINEGEILARIADLGSYKISGTCSDRYAERIYTGQRVQVRLSDEETLLGTIVNIRPTVENNVIGFEVQLDESSHTGLRPNMRVELFIITDTKSQAVRVKNGPAFTGRNTQSLFVLAGDVAERREVQIGLYNSDFVEIASNLSAGETVIISDMSRYEHLEKVKIDSSE